MKNTLYKKVEFDYLVTFYCIFVDAIAKYCGQSFAFTLRKKGYEKGVGFSNNKIKELCLNAKTVEVRPMGTIVVRNEQDQMIANKKEHDLIIKMKTSELDGGTNVLYGGAPLPKKYLNTPSYRVLAESKKNPGMCFDYDPRQLAKELGVSMGTLSRLPNNLSIKINGVYCMKHDPNEEYPTDHLFDISKKSLAASTSVFLFDINRKLIVEYKSRKLAAKRLKVSNAQIAKYLDTDNMLENYYLRSTRNFNLKQHKVVNTREVIKRNVLTDEEVAAFKNLKDASKKEGIPINILKYAIKRRLVFNGALVYVMRK